VVEVEVTCEENEVELVGEGEEGADVREGPVLVWLIVDVDDVNRRVSGYKVEGYDVAGVGDEDLVEGGGIEEAVSVDEGAGVRRVLGVVADGGGEGGPGVMGDEGFWCGFLEEEEVVSEVGWLVISCWACTHCRPPLWVKVKGRDRGRRGGE
jgi:hypothetical protein